MIEIPETLKLKSSRLALKLYQNQEAEDWMLIKFYMQVAESGEYEKIFIPEARPISEALACFKPPNTTFYALNDKKEIIFLFWVRPASNHDSEQTIVCSIWADEKFRKTKRFIQLTSLVYELIFTNYNYCMATTWQENLPTTFERAGYRMAGIIPHLYGIERVFVMFLTREDFYKSFLYELDQKIERFLS